MGGYWELPGGKREADEDDRIALAREITEEVGLELLAARPFVQWHHDYGDRYLTFHVYRCRVFDPSQAQALSSDEIRWVEPDEFISLDFPPANKPVLQRFCRYHRLPVTTDE
jgi:8-oxo-dGTP diphosphatase